MIFIIIKKIFRLFKKVGKRKKVHRIVSSVCLNPQRSIAEFIAASDHPRPNKSKSSTDIYTYICLRL